MATQMRRRNSVTRLIGNVVDDARDLADDVVDRAEGVERDGRKAIHGAVAETGVARDRSEPELQDLKLALDDLTAKVKRLVVLQAEAAPNPKP